MEREIGREIGRGREMDTHIDGAPDVDDVYSADADGEVIRPRSHPSQLSESDTSTSSSLPPTHADSNTQTHSYSNTQTKRRKPMLIPIPTDKGVELLQLPDYIPPRKDVWRELRAGDDEEGRGGKRDGVDGDGDVDGGDGRERGGEGEGGDDDDDEYAPLSIVKPYTPSSSYSSHSTYPHNNNPSSNPSSDSAYPYNPYTPSSSSYPSFTLNLGVEESPLGALTPLTPLTPMTPRTPGGRWFDPIPGQGQGQGQGEGRGQGEERDGTFDADTANSSNPSNANTNTVADKGKRRASIGQDKDTEIDTEYVDGDCGICFEEAVRPALTPCCARAFCAAHLDEWLQGTESDGRCPACKKRLDLSSYFSLSSPSFSSSRPLSQPHTFYRNDSDNDEGRGEDGGKYAGGSGVETTSAWKWLASWLVPEPATSTQHSASSAQPSHSASSTHHNISSVQSSHPTPSTTARSSSSQQQPSNSNPPHSKPAHNPPQSRGRYGSPYTPYPHTPLTGPGTPVTPGTPPATQGFIPMSPLPSTSRNGGAGRGREGRSVHPLSEHVEQERAAEGGGQGGGGGGGGKGGRVEEELAEVEREDREKADRQNGGSASASGSGSSSASTSRSNSSPEIAGEGSSSSTCTTPPLPTLSTLPAIVVDGAENDKPSAPVPLGDGDENGDEESPSMTMTMTKAREGVLGREEVDVVGTLSRFLSLVGLLGLFYVLLS